MTAGPADLLEDELREALAPSLLLVGRLGAGAMGALYRARDPQLRRDVAIKVVRDDGESPGELRARVLREGRAAAGLSHPNVVQVYRADLLPRSGTPYLVMQFVEGDSLEVLLGARRDAAGATRPLAEPLAKRIIAEVASALEAAHAHGIVHRDIKPANVLIEQATGRTVVVDFGIAAPFRTAAQQAPPEPVASAGTPRYMSPEQALGEALDDRSDVYSLGVLAYELLAGRAPFEARSFQELVAAHVSVAPVPLAAQRSGIDAAMSSLVDRCLAKAPADRPSAAEVARMLAPDRHMAVEWPPPGLAPLRGAGTRLAGVALVGSVLVALSLIGQATATSSIALGLGSVVLAVGVSRAIGLTRQLRGAQAAGFRADTLVEVLADVRHDAGRLVAGLDRFALLSRSARRSLRRGRVSALVLRAVLAPGALIAFFLGAVLNGRANVALLAMTVPALVVGWMLYGSRRRERRALSGVLPSSRIAHHAVPPAAQWEGAPLALYPRAPRWLPALASAALATGLGGVLVAAALLWMVARGADAIWRDRAELVLEASAPRWTHAEVASPVATSSVAGQRLLGALGFDADSLGARAATLRFLGGDVAEDPPAADSLFPEQVHGEARPWTERALLAARSGLSPAQRAVLAAAVASHNAPALDSASMLRGADWQYWVLRGGADSLPFDFLSGLPQRVLVARARSQVAWMALRLDAGDGRGARGGAAVIVRLGGLVAREARTLSELRAGRAMAAVGVRAARLAEGGLPGAEALEDIEVPSAANPVPSRLITEEQLAALIRDERVAPALRWEAALVLRLAKCRTPVRLLHGGGDSAMPTLAGASDTVLARMVVASVERTPLNLTAPMERTIEGALVDLVARASRLAGARHLAGCAARAIKGM